MPEETTLTLEERIAAIEAKIAEYEAHGDYDGYKYLTYIKQQTMEFHAGSTLVWQSGNPPPPPPYGGG